MTTTTITDSILSWLPRRSGYLAPSQIAAGVHAPTEAVRAALDELVGQGAVVFTGNGARRRFRMRRDTDLLSLTKEQVAAQHTLEVADLYAYGFDYDEDTHDLAWEELQRRAREGDDDALDFLGDCLDD